MTEDIRTNPLLEKRKRTMPGVTFRIPSRGIIYDSGIISNDVSDGEVVVYPMRLKEELKMKSLDSIFQGSAVSDTIAYCVPQVLDPDALCPTDIDYLITAIKKQTHGDNFSYKDVCMKIEQLVDRSTLLEENVKAELEENSRIGNGDGSGVASLSDMDEKLKMFIDSQNSEEGDSVSPTEDREFDPVLDNINNVGENSKFCSFNIPLSHFLNTSKELEPDVYEEQKLITFGQFSIELKHINFKDFKEISNLRLQDNPESMGEEEYYDYVTKFSNLNITKRIKSIDNIDDPALIEELVDSFSLQERKDLFVLISNAYEWGIDFNYKVKCSSCGKTKDLDMSYINPLYFFLTS